MASRELARNDGATLNTTALVHELYMKVCAGHELSFSDPAQFFSYAAQAMRHILVDRARLRLRIKRGSGVRCSSSTDRTRSPTRPPSTRWSSTKRCRNSNATIRAPRNWSPCTISPDCR